MLPMVDKQLCTQSLVLPKERRCVKTEDLNWRGDILTTNGERLISGYLKIDG